MMRTKNRSLQGFSLVEVSISLSILGMIAGVLVVAMESMRKISAGNETVAELQLAGQKVLGVAIDDLRRSGVADLGGTTFPSLVDEAVVPGQQVDMVALFGGQNRTSLNDTTTVGAVLGYYEQYYEGAGGSAKDPVRLALQAIHPSRTVRLLQPRDDDGDGKPDIEDGALVWDAAEVRYVLQPALGGASDLVRQEVGGDTRIVARGVERIVFDDAATSGFEIPLDSVRVQVWLRRTDKEGRVVRNRVQATVRLRNGG